MNLICKRDGESVVTVKFGPFEFGIAHTEFQHLLNLAQMDLQHTGHLIRSALGKPIKTMQESLQLCMTLNPLMQTDEDQKRNLARFHATGNGGVTDLQEAQLIIDQWQEKLKGYMPGTFEKTRAEWRQQYYDDAEPVRNEHTT